MASGAAVQGSSLSFLSEVVEKVPGIDHIIIIAGASGAGKTTFADQLQANALPDHIRARLPAGAETWERRRRAGSEQWLQPTIEHAAQRTIPGVILDYDTTPQFRIGAAFEDDPALKLIPLARTVTAVTLRPSKTQLIDRLLRRKGFVSYQQVANRKVLWAILNRIGDKRQQRLFKIMRRLFPRVDWSKVKSAERIWRKIKLYERPDWLEAMQENWHCYLTSISLNHIPVTHLLLQPNPATPTRAYHCWQLMPATAAISKLEAYSQT